LAARWVGDSITAVEAAAVLYCPQSDPDFRRARPVCPEKEHLQLRFLQAIDLCHHRRPSTLDQRTEQAAELKEVLANAVLEHHTVVKGARSSALIGRSILVHIAHRSRWRRVERRSMCACPLTDFLASTSSPPLPGFSAA